jgi:serine/threonine protein phosphatase PrpC
MLIQHFIRCKLPGTISNSINFNENPSKAFADSFLIVHNQFISSQTKEKGVDPMVSGSTAVCAMIHGSKCYVANVGDSRAILGYVDGDGNMKVKPLSEDHKPTMPSEKERIGKTSALLMTEKAVRGFGDENKVGYKFIIIYLRLLTFDG